MKPDFIKFHHIPQNLYNIRDREPLKLGSDPGGTGIKVAGKRAAASLLAV